MDYKIMRILYASIPYGTIIGDYSVLPHFLRAFHGFLESRKIDLLRLSGAYPGTPAFDIPRYSSRRQPIHLLSLAGKSEETLWQSYKRYVRRDIRRAERMGVVVEEIHERSEVEDFYSLYLCSMRRNRAVAKYPKSFIYSIYDLIITTGYGDIFFAKLGSEKIAGIMVLYSRNIAHYYFGGSRSEYHKYQPNEALLHRAICKAIKLEKSVFDFMGSDSRDINLIHFKEKWGATAHSITHYTAVRSRFRSALWQAGLHVLSSSGGVLLTRCLQRFR
jgi:CelD/BcsL family acetyltransferase involved in cellulose biosynthesis